MLRLWNEYSENSPREQTCGIRQIRKWIGDEGLVVAAVACPTRSGYGDADRLEGRIAATKAAMQLAHALGASVVTNHIGDIPPQFLPQESPKPDEQQLSLIHI